MPTAITPLANLTLSALQATVSFTSISSSYRDLYLVAQMSGGSVGNSFFCQINGDSSTGNYSLVYMLGNGASALTTFENHYKIGYDGALNLVHFMDYSATNKHKMIIARANDASSRVDGRAVRWANTSAITSLTLSTSGSGFAAGTSFALYGVSA